MNTGIIIAIDGPSGAGKTTAGRSLARQLGLLYIDTGAMYRAVALAARDAGVGPAEEEKLARVAASADIQLAGDPDSLQVRLEGRDVSNEIRTEEIGQSASVISTISGVRRALVERQREMALQSSREGRGAVLVGRDIGSVVFPDADVKFFLTATPGERAQRRFDEDRPRQPSITFEEMLADINARDQRDSTRADSPLVITDDAVVIDSTELSLEEVTAQMMSEIEKRTARGGIAG